jgi:hypothetical protein
VSLKIFTKVLNNRVTAIADRIISPCQSTFIPGHFILDEAVPLHETLHELHTKKKDVVVKNLILKRLMIKSNGLFYNKPLGSKDSHLCGVNGSIRLCQKGVSL